MGVSPARNARRTTLACVSCRPNAHSHRRIGVSPTRNARRKKRVCVSCRRNVLFQVQTRVSSRRNGCRKSKTRVSSRRNAHFRSKINQKAPSETPKWPLGPPKAPKKPNRSFWASQKAPLKGLWEPFRDPWGALGRSFGSLGPPLDEPWGTTWVDEAEKSHPRRPKSDFHLIFDPPEPQK